MDTPIQTLCDSLGQVIVSRDFGAVAPLLAPWLQGVVTPEALEALVDAQMEGLEHPPATWLASEGFAGLPELRKTDELGPPTQPLPREITDQNFRGWYCVQFAPDEAFHDEQNICYDVWLIPVEHAGAIRIGYLEAWEAS